MNIVEKDWYGVIPVFLDFYFTTPYFSQKSFSVEWDSPIIIYRDKYFGFLKVIMNWCFTYESLEKKTKEIIYLYIAKNLNTLLFQYR